LNQTGKTGDFVTDYFQAVWPDRNKSSVALKGLIQRNPEKKQTFLVNQKQIISKLMYYRKGWNRSIHLLISFIHH
jgi:hypothetical protein